ncbi:PIH1 domain-containing protein 1 isoform X3 [Mobula birostris]|uniref:PIH1 domain-containing protein 1 isoform X3 n=1 Tax=Mobula birostris TaxID=1983395 RepID=UPI003B289231
MTATTDKSLLSTEMQDEDALYEQLLLQAAKEMQSKLPASQESKQIRPQPGFCVKTKTRSSEKIFINVCKSEEIPPPPDLSEEDLVTLLESEDPSGYRIPMSLGEPHAEVDNKWRMLKNRKFLGSVAEQNIRTKSKPVIQELKSSSQSPESDTKPLVSEVESTCVEPEYTIVAEPADQHPSFLVANVSLPKVDSAGSLLLDLGEDRIVLWARPELYHLDIYIPYNIIPEESSSQFNRNTRVLTIMMPVQSA